LQSSSSISFSSQRSVSGASHSVSLSCFAYSEQLGSPHESPRPKLAPTRSGVRRRDRCRRRRRRSALSWPRVFTSDRQLGGINGLFRGCRNRGRKRLCRRPITRIFASRFALPSRIFPPPTTDAVLLSPSTGMGGRGRPGRWGEIAAAVARAAAPVGPPPTTKETQARGTARNNALTMTIEAGRGSVRRLSCWCCRSGVRVRSGKDHNGQDRSSRQRMGLEISSL